MLTYLVLWHNEEGSWGATSIEAETAEAAVLAVHEGRADHTILGVGVDGSVFNKANVVPAPSVRVWPSVPVVTRPAR